MAYRAPRPHAVKHSALQNRLSRIAGGALFVLVMVVFAGIAERAIPPQHAPWKPLRLIDPVGAATRIKAARAGEDPAACRAILRRAGLEFSEVESRVPAPGCVIEDAITLDSGLAPMTPSKPVMTCKEALAVSLWERQVVQPAAYALLGEGVARIEHYGSYSCRRIYSAREGAMSQHATADALDVGAFRLTDGSTVSVLKDWNDPGPKGQFLRRVRDEACKVFGTVLSPDYNAAHNKHLHLDMAPYSLCS